MNGLYYQSKMDPSTIALLTQTDLAEDLSIMEYVATQALLKLSTASDQTASPSIRLLHSHVRNEYQNIQSTVRDISVTTRNVHNLQDIKIYVKQAHTLFLSLRSLQGIMASILAAQNYQSPSFASSVNHQAGYWNGHIVQSVNDYTRDQHGEGRLYEQAFRKEYVDASLKFPLAVYATSSGMAAFTTILGFLMGEGCIMGNILIGRSSYFETKIMLHKLFPGKVVEVDEHDTPAIQSHLTTQTISALFLDTLCNSQNVAVPNASHILSFVSTISGKKPWVILDNTCLSVAYQPLKNISLFSRINILCWESLNKHHQYGFDRVTGGIMYGRGANAHKLYEYRDHLGTNISDVSALTLPTPNRALLELRLKRHHRNTTYLANRLSSHVVHPQHPPHPSSSWSSHLPFPGTILTLHFPPKKQTLSVYKKFLSQTLAIAKEKEVSLVGGTSFGLPTTRIYIPASRPGQGIPFLRIAVGCETFLELQRLSQVFEEALLKIK